MTDRELLQHALTALNVAPRFPLPPEPAGCRDSYALAALIGRHLRETEPETRGETKDAD